MVIRRISEKDYYIELKEKNRKERKKYYIEQEKIKEGYNAFVGKMEAAFWKSGISLGILANFMGFHEKSLRDFFANQDRSNRIQYKYAYILCIAFSADYDEAMEDMKKSGNPRKYTEKEDELLAAMELVLGMNLDPLSRLHKANQYIDFKD